VLRLLKNPTVWHLTRLGLDLALGLYRKRMRKIREWGVLDGRASVLDIGCGTGQYSALTSGEYVGIDLNAEYVAYARKRCQRPGTTFRCGDVSELARDGASFDIVLMVDFLHHVSDQEAQGLLETVGRLARRSIVSFEPVPDQTNPLGSWIVRHDRGHYVRRLERLRELFAASGLPLVECDRLRLGPIDTVALLGRPGAGSR
jgi:SAM-dependent methyltransferase